MNKMRKEKLGIVACAIYLIIKFVSTNVSEGVTLNILDFIMGMCVGLSLVGNIFCLLSENAKAKLNLIKHK
ncbi:MAG: hypothetical protein K0R15_297 [Clostridiales bacterium]|jgi:hypothetical protein|nr:hypothetical protein [Clostridiales bacterium]